MFGFQVDPVIEGLPDVGSPDHAPYASLELFTVDDEQMVPSTLSEFGVLFRMEPNGEYLVLLAFHIEEQCGEITTPSRLLRSCRASLEGVDGISR